MVKFRQTKNEKLEFNNKKNSSKLTKVLIKCFKVLKLVTVHQIPGVTKVRF